jgi:hypothetical protein
MKKGSKMSKESREKLSIAGKGNKNSVGNNGGRPTKYKKTFPKMILEYLKECTEEYQQLIRSTSTERFGESTSYDNILRIKLPKFSDICILLDVSKESLKSWSHIYPEFSLALRKVLMTQESMLLDGGVSGRYNSTIAKLILSSNHGYADILKPDQPTKVDDVGEMSDDELRRIANGG